MISQCHASLDLFADHVDYFGFQAAQSVYALRRPVGTG